MTANEQAPEAEVKVSDGAIRVIVDKSVYTLPIAGDVLGDFGFPVVRFSRSSGTRSRWMTSEELEVCLKEVEKFYPAFDPEPFRIAYLHADAQRQEIKIGQRDNGEIWSIRQELGYGDDQTVSSVQLDGSSSVIYTVAVESNEVAIKSSIQPSRVRMMEPDEVKALVAEARKMAGRALGDALDRFEEAVEWPYMRQWQNHQGQFDTKTAPEKFSSYAQEGQPQKNWTFNAKAGQHEPPASRTEKSGGLGH